GVQMALPPAKTVALLPPAAPSATEPTDPAQLAAWLAPRAAKGDALAEYRLGTLYALGKGVTKDYARAAPLLRAAAESGLAEAQYDYAFLYEHGDGVAKSPIDAYGWYSIAAARGDQGSKAAAARLAQTLSPGELKQAEARTMELQQSVKAQP